MGRPMMPRPMKPIFMWWSAPFGRAIFALACVVSRPGCRDRFVAASKYGGATVQVFVAVPGFVLKNGARNILQGQRGVEAEDLLELVDVVDLGAHGDVGDALQDEFHHDRHLVLLHQWLRLGEGLLELVRALDPDRLAAQALGHRDVIDAVALKLGAC